jgi:3-oxoadipate enol-lactonase
MIDRGTGSALVLIPGIQGRWEWMAPTVKALAARHRVLTFSLTEVSGASAFDAWTAHIDRALDERGLARAAVVGVSFGGLVAVRYAARRADRVSALVLVSAPSPRWRLDPRSAGYVSRPRIALPFFAARAVTRLAPEVRAARPTWRSRLAFAAGHAWRVLRNPPSPPRMAAWTREWMSTDIAGDCRRVSVPALVITGEPQLDRVVPVSSSLEYLALIPGARHDTLAGTGHIGLISKPVEFARLVSAFVVSCDGQRAGDDGARPAMADAMEG